MKIIKVVKNLKRLDSVNLFRLFIYKLKKKIKIRPSNKESELYIYYTYLIKYNGLLVEETEKFFISNFENKFNGLIKLRKRPSSDLDVFYQIYEFSEYLAVVKEYQKNFKNDSNYAINIIDAGSNIGLTSLFFTQHFETAKIIAVEPDTDNFEVLNFNLNSLKEKIKYEFILINGGVWSSNSKIKVINDFRDKSDWAFRVEETHELYALQAYSINHLAATNNFEYIDILKIDIEGSEKEVFTAVNSNVDFLNITKCIAIEIHDEFNCREEICSILENYGFILRDEGELTIGINEKLRSKLTRIEA